ncbi:MAG: DUF4911 domain-containing protein [Synergistaceae bacterium]|nr:DUF4911 domain-containing protein [Synergistaceae bacterium]
MDWFLLLLPRNRIVLLSWIVSEYDGLGFVTSTSLPEDCSGEWEKEGAVFLFFPRGRREDVLELLTTLKSEGMPFALHSEGHGEDFPGDLREQINEPEDID